MASGERDLRELFAGNKRVLTGSRLRIIEILALASNPLSAKEIWERMSEPRPDPATVYRSLAAMDKLGIIRRVLHGDSVSLYESSTRGGHSHHVVCRICGEKCDLPCDLLALLAREVEKASGFSMDHQSIEIIGRCPKCNK